jgi:predicted nucleic acid-binding protein
MNIVFDTYAMLALFRGDAGSENVLRHLRSLATDAAAQGYISTLAVGEIYGATLRKKNERAAMLVLEDLTSFPLHIADADYEAALEASRLRARHLLTAADAYTVALALQKEATLVAGSPGILALPLSVGVRIEVV